MSLKHSSPLLRNQNLTNLTFKKVTNVTVYLRGLEVSELEECDMPVM